MELTEKQKRNNWKVVNSIVPKLAIKHGYKEVHMVSRSVLRFENSKVFIDVYGSTLTVGVLFKGNKNPPRYSRQCSLEDIENIFTDNFFDNGTTYSELATPSKENNCRKINK